MHEQQVALLRDRHAHGRFAQIDRRGHTVDISGLRDLQPVEGVGCVRHLADAEVGVEVGDQLPQLHQPVGR